jgi:hypothetical protein
MPKVSNEALQELRRSDVRALAKRYGMSLDAAAALIEDMRPLVLLTVFDPIPSDPATEAKHDKSARLHEAIIQALPDAEAAERAALRPGAALKQANVDTRVAAMVGCKPRIVQKVRGEHAKLLRIIEKIRRDQGC